VREDLGCEIEQVAKGRGAGSLDAEIAFSLSNCPSLP
jgi:hypothetical protein